MFRRLFSTAKFAAAVMLDLLATLLHSLKSRLAATGGKPRNLVIGFDGYPFLEPLTGVGWYAHHLLEDFADRDGVTVNLYTHTLVPEQDGPELFIPVAHMKNLRFRHHRIPSDILPGVKLWHYLGACLLTPLFIALDQNDVFFAPNFVSPPLFRVSARKVITIHDCTFAFFPELLREETLQHLQKNLPKEVERAARIIAVSAQTRRDIEQIYPAAAGKVEVVYNGNRIGDCTPCEIADQPYLLFVGTLEPRKNIASILDAYRIVRDKGISFHLYLIGKVGWSSDSIIEKLQSHPYSSDISLLSYLPAEEIASFYKQAFCLLFPSLYEGFGLPVVEAMSLGCPVITTALASLPEVGGDACLYVDPDPESIAAGIVKLHEQPELRASLIEKGTRQARKFSWQLCADRTFEVLEGVALKRRF